MLDPLKKLIASKLDVVLEWYFAQQRFALIVVLPGTFLFLMLFWAFSGAGGLMLLLGLFLVAVECVLAAGLYLLQQRYEDEIRERGDAADAIEAFMTGSDVFNEWETFLAQPHENPEIEKIRVHCMRLPSEFPPDSPEDYCGAKGISILESYVRDLRAGYATKFFELAGEWWRNRRARKAERRTRRPADIEQIRRSAVADAVKNAPSINTGTFLDPKTHKHVEREAAKEARRAAKAAQREDSRAARTARRDVKKAAKLDKRERRLAEDAATAAAAARAGAPAAAVGAAPAAPAKRESGGLTEVAAIQQIMRSGYTAHHYDVKQQELTARLGRTPAPAEVASALLQAAAPKKKSRKRTPKRKAKRAKSVKAQRKRKDGRRSPAVAQMTRVGAMPAFGIADERPVRHVKKRSRALPVFLFLGALGGAPFVAWRVPRPNADPVVIAGEVRHQVLDSTADVREKLRTLFEEPFGNKPVEIAGGPRIYVNEHDYALCWPESWEKIYEKGYTVRITAEARPLLAGGYTVAQITKAEKISRPLAQARD